MTPIFLLSLPRSGSTLTQKILGAHEKIATASEPWLIIPYIYAIRSEGVYAEYGHESLARAYQDFIKLLPNKKKDYLDAVRKLILDLYHRASNKPNAHYFLDKTPRYTFISKELGEMFPDAKFIILWRNPLSIVTSVMESWAGGKWNLYGFKADLFQGLENLVQFYQENQDKVLVVHYENLVRQPEEEIKKICNYLNLEFTKDLATKYQETNLSGSMGDPTGIHTYQKIDPSSLDKWKKVLGNPIRRQWCKSYLNWIGKERLSIMGYQLEELLTEVAQVKGYRYRLGSDLLRISYGLTAQAMEIHLVRRKLLRYLRGERTYIYK